ncbi:MAG: hypothetical protein KJ561_00300 [Nanoarchaeota archaeon]|nr:hypothetical protein [Nanoarchaeota archaeon]
MGAQVSVSSRMKKILGVLKVIFLERIPMNILLLLIIISLAIVGFSYMKPAEAPTGNVILEPQCPECICEEKACENDCSLCPIKTKIETKNVIYHECPSGALVQDIAECEQYFPDVSELYSGKVSGITLSIEDIDVEKENADSGCVTQIKYVIINRGDSPIVPRINAMVYKEWNKDKPMEKDINPEIVVDKESFVTRTDKVRVCFQGTELTLRLTLTDVLKYPNQKVVALRDFELD